MRGRRGRRPAVAAVPRRLLAARRGATTTSRPSSSRPIAASRSRRAAACIPTSPGSASARCRTARPRRARAAPGNGVLTAVEDFVAARDGLRLAIVPGVLRPRRGLERRRAVGRRAWPRCSSRGPAARCSRGSRPTASSIWPRRTSSSSPPSRRSSAWRASEAVLRRLLESSAFAPRGAAVAPAPPRPAIARGTRRCPRHDIRRALRGLAPQRRSAARRRQWLARRSGSVSAPADARRSSRPPRAGTRARGRRTAAACETAAARAASASASARRARARQSPPPWPTPGIRPSHFSRDAHVRLDPALGVADQLERVVVDGPEVRGHHLAAGGSRPAGRSRRRSRAAARATRRSAGCARPTATARAGSRRRRRPRRCARTGGRVAAVPREARQVAAAELAVAVDERRPRDRALPPRDAAHAERADAARDRDVGIGEHARGPWRRSAASTSSVSWWTSTSASRSSHAAAWSRMRL